MGVYQVETDGGTYQVETEEGPETSALGAAGRGALDAVPFGTKAAAGVQSTITGGSYDKYLKELDDLLAADKSQHPVAHYGGEAAGTVAPFLIPGVGEALGAESLLGRAGVGVGLGALQGASNTREDLGSEAGIKDIAKGAGMGAILNGSVGAVGGLFKKGASSIGENLTDAATHTEVPNLSPTLSETATSIPKMMPTQPLEMGSPSGLSMSAKMETPLSGESHNSAVTGKNFTLDAPAESYAPSNSEIKAQMVTKMLGGTARQVRNLPGKNLVQSINRIGEVLDKNKLIDPLDRFPTRHQKVLQAHDVTGKLIGDMADKVNSPATSANDLVQEIAGATKFPNPDQVAQLTGLQKQVAAYADANGGLSFQRLRQLKKDIGDEAFTAKGDPILQKAYHVIGNKEDQMMDVVSNQPGIDKSKFDSAKELYQVTSRALPMLRMATAKTLVNNPSLTQLLSGHPIQALTSAVAEPLHRTANAIGFKTINALGKNGTSASGISANVPVIPPNYAPVFQKATQGLQDPSDIQKAHTVTDFLLQSRDPNYVAQKQKMTEGH